MEPLIIQLGAKHGRLAEIYRSDSDVIRVGRSFRNQLVLTDPYVEPEQAQFYATATGWRLQIKQQTNRTLKNGSVLTDMDVAVQPGDSIIFGRTELRLYTQDYPVEATRKLLLSGWMHSSTGGVFAPILTLVAVMAAALFSYFMDSATRFEWKPYAGMGLVIASFSVVWAGAWALTSRLIRHQYHYGQHLLIVCIALIVTELIFPVATYLGFMFSSYLLEYALSALFSFIILVFMLRYHLFFATHARRPLRTGFITIGLVTLVICGLFYTTRESSVDDRRYSDNMQPGYLYPAGSVSSEQYLSALDRMASGLIEEAE